MAVSNLKNSISIIEQGTETLSNVTWIYRKWSDGVAECWGQISAGSIAMTAAEGSAYYAPMSTYSFPSIFTITPRIVKAVNLNGACGDFSINSTNPSVFSGYWWASRSVTKTVWIDVYAIGRWK